MASAFGCTPVCQFFVGNIPALFIMLTRTAVPYLGRPSLVTGWDFIFSTAFLTTSLYLSGSAGSGLLLPPTTIAFNPLLPIIAPTPVLPAALWLSFIMAENRTPFSPAGPMHVTLHFPYFSVRIFVVSNVVLPHRCVAVLISAPPSKISRYTGSGEAPLTITASNPANFK